MQIETITLLNNYTQYFPNSLDGEQVVYDDFIKHSSVIHGRGDFLRDLVDMINIFARISIYHFGKRVTKSSLPSLVRHLKSWGSELNCLNVKFQRL